METPAIGLFSAILTCVRSVSHTCWSNQPNSPAKFSFKHIPWCVKLTSTTLLARLGLYCLNTFTLECYIQLAKSRPEGLAHALRPLAAVTHVNQPPECPNDGQVNRKSVRAVASHRYLTAPSTSVASHINDVINLSCFMLLKL